MISETLNTLFLVVNFVKCVFTEVVIVAFKGEVKAKNSIASNEPLCLIKLHILHENDYLCQRFNYHTLLAYYDRSKIFLRMRMQLHILW